MHESCTLYRAKNLLGAHSSSIHGCQSSSGSSPHPPQSSGLWPSLQMQSRCLCLCPLPHVTEQSLHKFQSPTLHSRRNFKKMHSQFYTSKMKNLRMHNLKMHLFQKRMHSHLKNMPAPKFSKFSENFSGGGKLKINSHDLRDSLHGWDSILSPGHSEQPGGPQVQERERVRSPLHGSQHSPHSLHCVQHSINMI